MKKTILFNLMLLVSFCLMAQSGKEVKGKVLDKSSGETLIGVSVTVKGASSQGTITDLDGSFKLNVPDDNSMLEFNYVGYKTITILAQNNMIVELDVNALGLDEVVVVGYGTMRKSDLTGSLSSVKGADLNVLSTANVASALAGRSSGVQVTSSGSVDGSVKVRVRGIGTINNSDPLYVVDGFPTSDISHIAPSDIESMEVLKDASASAIYGSRGANGVILITTKKGTNTPTQISVNSYLGVRKASKYIDVLNAREYAHARIEAYENANVALDPNELAILNYSINNNLEGTDWQKEVLRTAVVQNYNISVIGGNDKAKYNLSTTYNDEEGILKNSFVEKLFIKLNTEYKFYKNVTFGSDISFVDHNMSSSDLSNMHGSALMLATRAAPVSPVFDQSGNWANTMNYDNNAVRVNELEKHKYRQGSRFVGNFNLNIDITKGLSFKSTFGADYAFGKNKNYLPVYFVSQQENNKQSSLEEERNKSFNWVWSNVVNYNVVINKVHSLGAMVGTEATYNNYDNIYAKAYDVSENSDMQFISAAKSNDYLANSFQGNSSIFSTFYRLNYSYQNRYLVTGTLRTDASSRFSKKERVGVFPSVSLGWNVKEESFLQKVDFMTQFKIRAGWGQVGNQSSTGIGDYLSQITNGLKYVLGGQVYEGRVPTALSNPNLKWEVAEQYNFGTDISLFDSKLQLTADYFIKDTKDMIVRAPVPGFVGATEPLDNVGTMRNKGFELSLNHQNKISDLEYNVGLNLSFIKNEVTHLGRSGAIHATVYQERLSNTSRTEVGREIAFYYGYKTDGVFNTQDELDAHSYLDNAGVQQAIQPNAKLGDVKYQDLNGNGRIDEGDLTYLGSYIPDFSGGFNLGAKYKNFTFSLFADFVVGNKIANMPTYDLGSSLVDKNITKDRYDNRWTEETPNNNAPRLTIASVYKENDFFSDRYIEDGSFLRIRNVQLGYYLPEKWMNKVKVRNARIYMSIDNLATFTKYSGFNPEIADQWGNVLAAGSDVGSTPLPRTISFGINVNF